MYRDEETKDTIFLIKHNDEEDYCEQQIDKLKLFIACNRDEDIYREAIR